MPREYPLAFFEMSFLLPHFLREGRGKLAMYFTRVYNPVWTNPDGMSWIEMLTDEAKVERHACLTPIWSETAWFADYVLPMGHASERHDLMSQETHAARWIGFRQPVLRVALEKAGQHVRSHLAGARGGRARAGLGGGRVLDRAVLADRSRRRARHPEVLRVAVSAGREAAHRGALPLDLREQRARAARGGGRAEGLTPLEYMRKYGAFLIEDSVYRTHEQALAAKELDGATVDPATQVVTKGGQAIGVEIDGRAEHRLPDAVAQARVLLRDAQGVEVAGAGGAQLHPQPRPLVEPRPREGRDGAAAHVPAADAHPHALGQREVALRDLAHQSALAPSRGRRARSAWPPATCSRSRTAHRPLRRPGVGHRGGAARRRRVLASSRALAPARGRGRRALVHRAGRPQAARARASGGCARSTAPRPFTSEDPDSERIWWEDGRRPPEPHVPRPARSGQRPALLASEGHRVDGPAPTIATATCSWTRTSRSRSIASGWRSRARRPGPGNLRRPLWLPRAFKPDASAYRLDDT